MSPVYLNPQTTSSPIPFLELKGDHTQHGFQVFGHLHNLDDSHNRRNSEEILSLDYSKHEQKKVGKLVFSSEQQHSWLQNTVEDDSGCSYGYSKTPVHYTDKSKWKPTKVRITTTSKNSRNNKQFDHDHLVKSDGIRVCTDCHTTTTPLWRSGPQGPKSLCNACGIRQRKARRAAMAAAGFGNDNAIVPSMTPPPVVAPKPKVQVIKSEKGLHHHQDKSHTLPIKKRSKIIIDAAWNNNNSTTNNNTNINNNNAKKICIEHFALSSNMDYLEDDNSTRSFQRDEEEGAILLMALSCGLACSS